MGCCGSNGNGTGEPPIGSIERVQKSRRRICEQCPSGEFEADADSYLGGRCRVLGVDVGVVTLSSHDCPHGWFTEETAGRSLPEMKRAANRCIGCDNARRAGVNMAERSCIATGGDLIHFHRELSTGSCPVGRWAANPRAGDPLIHAGDLTGSKPPPTSLVERRLALCGKCEHRVAPGLHVRLAAWIMRLPFLRRWRPDSQSMCARCRCWIELKARAKWSRCPIGKW